MPVLIDEIITVQFFLFAFIFTLLLLKLIVKFKVVDSWFDPAIVTFFQLTITFFSLSYLKILPVSQVIGFVIFMLLLFCLSSIKLKPVKIIPVRFWIQFSYFLLIIVVVSNAFITFKKGFIYLAEDAANARLVYYQGYGLFQRINHLGAPILAINSFYLLRANKKVMFYLYIIVSVYLLVALGSKSSLLAFIFFYGAYYKFHKDKEKVFLDKNKGKLILLVCILFVTSLGMFFLIYKDNFLSAFAFRMIAMSDGPFYFYYDHLQKWISYSPMYMFDQFLVAVRVHPDLQYMGLGAKINYYYYDYYDLLNGPNPQIFVESQVMFGPYSWIMYIAVAFIYWFLSKIAASPITFYFLITFAVVLTIDSQYAFSLIFDYMLLGVLMVLFWGIKFFINSVYRDNALTLK